MPDLSLPTIWTEVRARSRPLPCRYRSLDGERVGADGSHDSQGC